MIIGLLGRAGSGKSTCGEWLRRERGAKLFSLADPLKCLAKRVFDFSDAQLWGTQAEKEAVDSRYGLSAREALIRLGDGARRELGEGVWARACMDAIAQVRIVHGPGKFLAAVTDVRYANEARMIRAAGGAVVKLTCPDAATSVDPDAPSERSVDEVPGADVDVEVVANRSPNAEGLIRTFRTAVDPILLRAGAW